MGQEERRRGLRDGDRLNRISDLAVMAETLRGGQRESQRDRE
jgi:hypothetical protein